MKKILFIILCVISVNAYAQLDCDLGLELLNSSDTNIVLNYGDTAEVYIRITNYGPDILDTDDYVYFRFDGLPPNINLVADDSGHKVYLLPDSSYVTDGILLTNTVPDSVDYTDDICFYLSFPQFYFVSDTNSSNDSAACIHFTYKASPTGIKDIKETNFFSAYPNPTTDNVFLKFDKNLSELLHIRVYNVVGQLLSQYQIPKVNTDNIQKVDLRPYPSGMYFIEAYTDKMKQRIKVVKR